MSKAVKSIGRAIKGVVKGVTKVVKKVATSKFGKIISTAALIYFGGAALSGAFSGASGGLSGALSGAATGVSNAWSALTTAGSAALGGNFSQAGSALMSGIQGQATSGLVDAAAGGLQSMGGQGLVGGSSGMTGAGGTGFNLPSAANTFSQPGGMIGQAFGGGGFSPNYSLYQAAGAAPTSAVAPAAQSSGLVSKFMSSPYAAPAAISVGGQLAGGLISGRGQQMEQEDQRRRYNTNVGTRLYGTGR